MGWERERNGRDGVPKEQGLAGQSVNIGTGVARITVASEVVRPAGINGDDENLADFRGRLHCTLHFCSDLRGEL